MIISPFAAANMAISFVHMAFVILAFLALPVIFFLGLGDLPLWWAVGSFMGAMLVVDVFVWLFIYRAAKSDDETAPRNPRTRKHGIDPL